MEFLQWLKGEHQTARQLLETAMEADGGERQQAWEKFRTELQLHHRLEERFFYPLGEGFSPTRDLAEHAIEETHEVDEMLEKLDPEDARFGEQAAELQRMLDDHMEEEETELAPKLFQSVPAGQQEKLVETLEQVKKQESQTTM